MQQLSCFAGHMVATNPAISAALQHGLLPWQQHIKTGISLCRRQWCAGIDLAVAGNLYWQGRAISYNYTHRPKKKHDPYRTPPTNYVQLLQHITRAKKVDTLDKLVMRYGPKFDAVHVAAAMSMLPKLYQPVAQGTHISPRKMKQKRETPEKLLQQLQLLASAQVPRMFAREVASITWSLGRLRSLLPSRGRDPATRQLLSSMLHRVSKDNCRLLYQGASGAEVAKLLHGMASVGHSDAVAVKQLCRFITKQPQKMHAKELAAAAWALARMESEGPDTAAALDAISAAAVHLRLYMRPASICSLLTAAARRNWRDDQLLTVLTQEAYEQISDFKAPQLAVLMWSLGRLQFTPEPRLLSAVNAASRRQLDHFGSCELGLLLKGLRQLNGLNNQLLSEVAAGIRKEQQVALTPRDAARILSAFVAAPTASTVKDVDGMAVRIASGIRTKIARAKPHVITDLLVCYSKLQCHDPVVPKLLQHAVVNSSSFVMASWVSMLQSCQRLGLAASSVTEEEVVSFYEAADKHLQQHLLGAAAPETVAAVTAAAGKIREEPADQGLWQRLVGRKPQQQKLLQPEQQPEQQQQAHRLQFGPAVDIALLISERGALGPNRPALSEKSVIFLADVGAKLLLDMQPRRLMLLLTAVLTSDKNAALDEVRNLLVAAGTKLQGMDLSQVSWPVLVGLTKPLGRAVSKNMLVVQGEQLLQGIYEQVLQHVDSCDEEQLRMLVESMSRSGVVHAALMARAEARAQQHDWKMPKQQEWRAFL